MPRSPLVPCVLALALFALLPGIANAQGPAGSQTLTATGRATVEPEPEDRTSNASIRAAVQAAQVAALPAAIAQGRVRAQRLADAASLTLGPLQAIADAPPSPFGADYGTEGTFGPGQFCGRVRRYRTRRLSSGRIKRVIVGSRRTCRVPTRVSAVVILTYGVTPRP